MITRTVPMTRKTLYFALFGLYHTFSANVLAIDKERAEVNAFAKGSAVDGGTCVGRRYWYSRHHTATHIGDSDEGIGRIVAKDVAHLG